MALIDNQHLRFNNYNTYNHCIVLDSTRVTIGA